MQKQKTMAPKSRDLPIEVRAAPIEAFDSAARTITVVWTTGAAVERYDWWTEERYVEELVVSDNAIRMGRMQNGANLLDNHMAYGGVTSALGVVERAWLEGGKGYAEVRFPSEGVSVDADRAFRMVVEKITRNISVGYKRHRIEVDRTGTVPVWRVVDWEPYEISLVLVPADPGAQVRSKDDEEKAPRHECEFVYPEAQQNEIRSARMRMRMLQHGLVR